MKKFYESPIVELTVFDVEDVITTSAVIGGIDTATQAGVDALIADIQNATTTAGGEVTAQAYSSSYNW